ncbi:MAG: MFS transporter, partial [Bifidobacteriaceae bacterium]|nr:MFS transporter [Bifidobacteriaceae bacterium]
MKSTDIAYLGSATFSALGNALTAVVFPVLVLATTGSVISAGVVALTTGLPQFVAAAVGGVLLDRLNRRTIAITGDVISALAVAALPIIDATLGLTTGWFMAFGVLSAVGDVPAMTAREALVPALNQITGTPKETLIGAREGLSSLGMIAGPALAAALVLHTTPAATLWVTAATSALAALCMLTLPAKACLPAVATPAKNNKVWNQFADGVRYLTVENPTLRTATLVGLAVAAAVGVIQGIVLPFHFTLSGQAGRTGITLGVMALGTILGT